jgi:hypothetical protein
MSERQVLVIQPEDYRSGKKRKGRSFEAHLLHVVVANNCWNVGNKQFSVRPVMAAWGGSSAEVAAFTANARTGRKVWVRPASRSHTTNSDTVLEFLRSAPYRWVTQRLPHDMAATFVYLPALFDLDPGVPPDRVVFCMAAATWWVEQQVDQLQHVPADVRREVAVAALFAAYLDRRTAVPLISDWRFHLRCWHKAADQEWFHKPSGYLKNPGDLGTWPERGPLPGVESVVLVDATHEDVEKWLEGLVREHFAEVGGDHGEQEAPALAALPPPPVEPDPLPVAAVPPEPAFVSPPAPIVPPPAPIVSPPPAAAPAQLSLFDLL